MWRVKALKIARKKGAGDVTQQLRGLAANSELSFQDPPGGLQPAVALVLGDTASSSGLFGYMWYIYIHAGKTFMHIK